MNDLAKYNLSPMEKLVADKYADMKSEYDKSEKKLKDCLPMLKAAFEVKEMWESEGINRECNIIYNNHYNYPWMGFEIRINLGPTDRVKDSFKCLRPLKYNSPVDFKGFISNDERGMLGAEYQCKTSQRLLTVEICVRQSNSCKQVKVGEKLVPVYKTVCSDPKQKHLDEDHDLLVTELKGEENGNSGANDSMPELPF